MKRSRTGRVVPSLLMTAAVAIPVVTTAELVAHVSGQGTASLAAQPTSQIGASTSSASSSSPSSSGTSASSSAAGSAAPGVHVSTGPAVQEPFGTVQASVSMNGNKITNVSITAPMDNPRSAAINSQAVPMLKSETLQAQSAQVNLISGATYTSAAFRQSLQGALAQAKGAAGSQSNSGSSTVALAPQSGVPTGREGSDD